MRSEGGDGGGGAEVGATLAVGGVGASAGGLEAFQELISSIAPEQQRAWVLVQHLDPDHQSLLPELLARRTRLPVVAIQDGQRLEPGVIHLIPPGEELRVSGRTLRLAAFAAPRGLRRPIDVFFESLAVACGVNCAAIVLSGTGSDGSVGIRAVKEAGGLVFVQDPKQAKYDGMPKSALATNAVDLVLPVGDMVSVLDEYFDRRSGIEPSLEDDAEFVERVAKHIRYRTGHDFSHYKRPTLLRRLARRMSVLGVATPTAYLQKLITDADEASFLFRDLLINVTSFFRDPSAFDMLRRSAIPQIVRGKGRGDDVRIWVPGCSSGQEAYSIAMLVEEELQRVDARPNVSIFATDIDVDSLKTARDGVFPTSIAGEVPPAMLERHFTSTPQGYRISPAMRDMVRVSNHNVTKDPPFSRVDLVSCRNLLIYFDAQLQSRAFSIFHYSIVPGGFLLLGPSENLGAASEQFEPVEHNERLFRRKDGPARPLILPPSGARREVASDIAVVHDHPAPTGPPDLWERAVLARHTPSFVVVNARREIVYASGRTGRFLELSAGRAQLGLLEMCKPELKPALRGLLSSVGEPGRVMQRPFDGRIDNAEVRLLLAVERLRDDTMLVVARQSG